jgi:hypothetical protein
VKYKQIQQKGFTFVRDEIISQFKATTLSAQNASTTQNITGVTPQLPSNQSTIAENQYYLKFKVLATKIRFLCSELEKRRHLSEYFITIQKPHFLQIETFIVRR